MDFEKVFPDESKNFHEITGNTKRNDCGKSTLRPSQADILQQSKNDKIIQKYEEGPNSEDIENSQYKSTNVNRYGFIVGSNSKYLDARICDEAVEIKKWSKILQDWTKYNDNHKKIIRKYISDGVPDSMRGLVWKKLLKIDEQIIENIGVYESLTKVARKRSLDLDQIDKDVERTLRHHVSYNVRYSIKQKQLFWVLAAYSVFDSKIRYCQGMNELAGTLLFYLSPEETFYILKTLFLNEIHNFRGFYVDGFPKLQKFQDHLLKTINFIFPNLSKHFLDIGFDIKMFATKWFLLWFINSLPFGIVLRILDRFMLEGSIILYVVAYTIIKYHRKYLINSSLDEIAIFFKELERFKYDSEVFFQKLDKNIRKLTELKFYPIPGVEHDFENIDIAAIINEDVESDSDTKSCYQFPIQSDTWSLNFSNKEPDNYDGSFYKISSESTTINHLHSESSLSCNANLFDPTSHKPPTPPITWEKFTESSEEIFIQGIKELDSSKIQLSQSMLCQLIEKAYRVQSSN